MALQIYRYRKHEPVSEDSLKAEAGSTVSLQTTSGGRTFDVQIDDSVVADLDDAMAIRGFTNIATNPSDVGNTLFIGAFSGSMSGSLTHLEDGTSYLIAGDNITIVSESNGAVTISSTGGGGGDGADPEANYLLIGNTGSLDNERAVTGSLGVKIIDGGAGNSVDFRVNEDDVPFLSASNDFSGKINLTGGSGDVLEIQTSGTANFHGNKLFYGGVVEVSPSPPPEVGEGELWYDTSGSGFGVAGNVPINAVSTTYTAVDDDTVIIANASGGPFSIGLPSASGNGGKIFYIKKVDATSNQITVDPSGSQTIDGQTTKIIQNQYSAMMIISDNNEWWIL